MESFDPYSHIPVELRSRFQQVFELEIQVAPFEDGIVAELSEASRITCRTEDFANYLLYSISRVDLLILLRKRRSWQIISFATASLRTDIGVAVLSLICAAYDDNVSYGIITHGVLARELLRRGITEIALSSVNDNESYYSYLGYSQTQMDARGRILARTYDGRTMVMNDISKSTLVKVFPQKLEKTLGILQSLNSPFALQTRKVNTLPSWKNLLRYWQHSFRYADDVPMKELDWSYEELPYPSKVNVLESGWVATYTSQDRRQTLREADWVSSFKLNNPAIPYVHAFVMGKQHGDDVELFPWAIHRLGENEKSIPIALLAVAAVLMLRFLRREKIKRAFIVGSLGGLYKALGFTVQQPWENVIVPTTKDFYVLDLNSVNLTELTANLIDAAWEVHNNATAMAALMSQLPSNDQPLTTKAKAKMAAKRASVRAEWYSILGGLAMVEVKWDTTKTSQGEALVDTYVLKARVLLQELADWSPPGRRQAILAELKTAVADNPEFSKLFPAVGYFTILYELEPISPDADLDLRMSQFYSALALMESPPAELKGIMAIALGTTLINELKRGTILPSMKFGLEASGDLGDKDMYGLVEYYRNTLGLQVVKPEQLDQDVKDGNVIMMTTVSNVVDACSRKFRDLRV